MLIHLVTTNGNHTIDASKESLWSTIKNGAIYVLKLIIKVCLKIIDISEKALTLLEGLPEDLDEFVE